MTIYCFSGLGADERAFQFLHFPEHMVIHVSWIEPIHNESLISYANRISKVIDSSEPYLLLGLSFGGMLCVEIAKMLNPKLVILLSSITCRDEMPIRMKISGSLNLYKMIPNKYITKPSRIAHFLFGTSTILEKNLLNQILIENDPKYIKWALNAIAKWRNTEVPACYRIHGTADRIFPVHLVKVQCSIEKGGHLMIISHAEQVNKAINSCIALNNVKNTANIEQKQ